MIDADRIEEIRARRKANPPHYTAGMGEDIDFLLTHIEALEQERDELVRWKEQALTNPECVHCGSNDMSIDHWKRCEPHPARIQFASAERVITIANELFSAVTFYWDKATPRNRDLASRLLREYDKEESRHREAYKKEE